MADEVEARDKNVKWYAEQPEEIAAPARKLLEDYSKIPPEKVLDHVLSVREKAWQIFPYPCIGQFRFLDLSIQSTQVYQEVIQRLKEGEKLLDMACCFGQEIRKLVSDGAPSENIYGADLRPEFIDLGYDLFLDRDTLKTKFVTADIFAEESALTALRGHFDIIYTGSFFHLWGYDDQFRVSVAVARLLKPVKGATLIGRQVGALNAVERFHATNATKSMFRHNVDSLKKLWKDVGDTVGASFSVDATLVEPHTGTLRFNPDDTKMIKFVIRRD